MVDWHSHFFVPGPGRHDPPSHFGRSIRHTRTGGATARLSVNSYTPQYIADCRARVAARLSAYQALAATAKPAAVEAVEPAFCADLALAIDASLVHRAGAREKKDGNPLNEMGMLCNGIMSHGGRMAVDQTIKYDPKRSVLKYQIGDRIALRIEDIARRAKAFFAEIESKY